MDTLFRRRVIALGLLFLFIAVISIFQNSNFTLWGAINNSGNYGAYAAGNPYTEWVYIDCDGDEQQVTILQNGELRGIDGIDRLNEMQFPNHCSLPMVDHPFLSSWQEQLESLKRLTAKSESDAEEIVEIALGMQLSALYVEPVSEWIEAAADNPQKFIDALISDRSSGERSNLNRQRKANLADVVNQALFSIDLAALDADTMEQWLDYELIGENSDILVHLGSQNYQNAKIALLLLEQVDHVDRKEQREYFYSLASPLASMEDYAGALQSDLTELARKDRTDIARDLLADSETNLEFAKAILADFDDLIYGNQEEVEIHQIIAERLKEDPSAPRLLTQVLQDLDSRERRVAAVNMIEMGSSQSTQFIHSILDDFDEFHSNSKELVAEAIIRSEDFAQVEVQEALLEAVEFEMEGDKKRSVLRRMLRVDELDPQLEKKMEDVL